MNSIHDESYISAKISQLRYLHIIYFTQMVQCLFLSQNMGYLIQTSRVRRDVKLPFFLSLHHNRQFRRIVEGKTLNLQNTNNKFLDRLILLKKTILQFLHSIFMKCYLIKYRYILKTTMCLTVSCTQIISIFVFVMAPGYL